MNQEPQATPEITAFMEQWADYANAVRDFRADVSLSYWERSGYPGAVERNQAELEALTDRIAALHLKGEELDLTHAEATATYRTAHAEWERQQEQERERPRREWEEAKANFERDLERAIRGIAIKNGKLESKRWRVATEERAEIENQILLNEYASRAAQTTLNAIEYARYRDYEGRAFDADLVAELEAKQEARIAQLVANFEARLDELTERRNA